MKTVLYIAMSLDGYIATENKAIDWLSGDGSAADSMGSYDSFYETVDRVIMGYATYNQVVTELSPDIWPYEGKKSYVLTSKALPDTENIKFISTPLPELIKKLKVEGEKDIWICGGSKLVNSMMSENLIDRYHITVIPTILGGGIPLFEKSYVEHKLKLISANNCGNGFVDLIYEPRD